MEQAGYKQVIAKKHVALFVVVRKYCAFYRGKQGAQYGRTRAGRKGKRGARVMRACERAGERGARVLRFFGKQG